MSQFKTFKAAMQKQFQYLVDNNATLFLTDVSRDAIWEKYMDAFPEGTNNIYKERREYDCVCCRQFLRPYANVVAIVDNQLVTIWDIEVEGYYQEVADKLSQFVKSQPVRDIFVSEYSKLGTDISRFQEDNGDITKFNHFYFELPKTHYGRSSKSVESIMGDYRQAVQVFNRSLETITLDAIETVLELIVQNSIYRGTEFKSVIESFLKYKELYLELRDTDRSNYCWKNVAEARSVAKMRNTAIGTLLVNISEGMELDHAVSAFEKIMAPTNYKRPTALLTPRMIAEAQDKITELGYENSLGRRYAVVEDVTVNNVIFVDREVKKKMGGNVFDELTSEVKADPKKFDRVEEVSIDTFMKDILPTAKSVELMVENKHTTNFMSLISPIDKEAPSMFKWNNNFSWAYNGDLTDSIKEKVKAAGGRVDGELRCSLSWNNSDDLDIHVIEPDNTEIYYGSKNPRSSCGTLDVDMNASSGGSEFSATDAVENVIWIDKARMKEGTYKVIVHNYTKRTKNDIGFEMELEHNGEIHSFNYDKDTPNKGHVEVVTFTYSKSTGIKVIKSIPSSTSSREIWGVNTNKFVKVSTILNSPNYWDEQTNGNKHCFFILDGCVNEATPRGFFNEFLKPELETHKRVFEALGSKMKVEPSERQLSGVGFSSTQTNSVVCKVSGAVSRTIKINF